ncbi:jg20263 [Pararge aegeria aegeria]|uniref:Jg20263 protein n=1 Tax=Pararge aegeria aegeria TaxID=348720 RepID=A0A8S4R6U1_9NEOP|nr:jg20263 [Pararge aegeria aegeria]
MDRYVIREQRTGREHPEGNQMIAFSATTSSTGNNITIPETMYFGEYGGEVQNANVQHLGTHRLLTPHLQRHMPQTPNVIQVQSQMASGIDPRYLAYLDNNTYVQTMRGGDMPPTRAFQTFGSDYQNCNFVGAETNKRNTQTVSNNANLNRPDPNNNNLNRAQINKANFNGAQATNLNFNANNRSFNNTLDTNNQMFNGATASNNFNRAAVNTQNFNGQENNRSFKATEINVGQFKAETNKQNFKGAERNAQMLQTKPKVILVPITQATLTLGLGGDVCIVELQKGGTRIFSGPVEKILKWHKSIQDIGVMVLYEIVGKCVNVRAGETCAKNLVVRDENGPAIQVVYYEIDFLLPELKPPCTIRVIGRMMPGTNRFQAYNVRPATGDDVATLPRRAAVAAHHVAKLCKEYGVEVLILK